MEDYNSEEEEEEENEGRSTSYCCVLLACLSSMCGAPHSDVQLSCLGIQEIKMVFNCMRIKLCGLSMWRCKDRVKESVHWRICCKERKQGFHCFIYATAVHNDTFVESSLVRNTSVMIFCPPPGPSVVSVAISGFTWRGGGGGDRQPQEVVVNELY